MVPGTGAMPKFTEPSVPPLHDGLCTVKLPAVNDGPPRLFSTTVELEVQPVLDVAWIVYTPEPKPLMVNGALPVCTAPPLIVYDMPVLGPEVTDKIIEPFVPEQLGCVPTAVLIANAPTLDPTTATVL